MNKRVKRAVMALALGAASLTAAGAAEAREHYRDHDNGEKVAIAIGAGLVGLAIGAALADRDDRHYYDRGYYHSRRYVRVSGYPGYYYYYDGYPNRYYRDRYYDRYYGRHYRDYRPARHYRRDLYERRHYDRWDRGQRRVERWYGRDRYDRNGYRRDYRDRSRHWRD